MTSRKQPKLKPALCCWLCCWFELDWCAKYERASTENCICDGFEAYKKRLEMAQNECDQP